MARSKKRVFSERQRDAILRIAYKPIETKHFYQYTSWQNYLINTGYLAPSAEHAFRQPFVALIERTTNAGDIVAGQERFDGSDIQLKGLRWEMNLTQYAATPGSLYDVHFRFTVYSMNFFYPNSTEITGANSEEIDLSLGGGTFRTSTWFKWNMEEVDIHFQKNFRINNDGNLNAILKKKFWIPFNKKLTTTEDDSPTPLFNDRFNNAKQKNMYWALEMYAPGLANLQTQFDGAIAWMTYFKDG